MNKNSDAVLCFHLLILILIGTADQMCMWLQAPRNQSPFSESHQNETTKQMDPNAELTPIVPLDALALS